MTPELLEKLKKLAKRKTWTDDLGEDEFLDPDSMSGGNYDDCYSSGQDDGETNLAREVLTSLGEKW